MGRSTRFLLGAAALLTPGLCVAAPVQPVRWSLHPPSADAIASAIARSFDGVSIGALTSVRAAVAPELVGARVGEGAGLRLAPVVTNLLNSRRASALETVGAPGSGEGYLRGLHRTIGVALRKSIF